MNEQVLGIDPSLRATGFAWRSEGAWYVDPYEGWHTCVCRGDYVDSVRTIIGNAYDHGCKIAYIEDGYLGINPKTSKQLDQLRGRMQAWCLMAGMRYEMVLPGEWHIAMLGKMKKGESKTKSIAVAKDLGADVTRVLPSGKRRVDDNLADAVCISEYGRLQEGMR